MSTRLAVPGLILQLPDTPWREANKLLADYREAHKKRQEAGAYLAHRRTQDRVAKQQDIENLAEHLRSGEDGQGPASVEKALQEEITLLTRHVEALTLNRTKAADAFLDHMEQNREAYLADLETQLSEVRPRASATLHQEALELLIWLASWKDWLKRYPTKAHALIQPPVSVWLGGYPFSPRVVIDALKTAVNEVGIDQPDEEEESNDLRIEEGPDNESEEQDEEDDDTPLEEGEVESQGRDE